MLSDNPSTEVQNTVASCGPCPSGPCNLGGQIKRSGSGDGDVDAFYKNFEIINLISLVFKIISLNWDTFTEENRAKRNEIQIEQILLNGLFIETKYMFLCDHTNIFMFCACVGGWIKSLSFWPQLN